MKKVALSLLAFALVGGAAFADATADVVKSPVTASLEVNGSASWGYDLDTKVHGFSNSETGKVTLWFANGTSTKTGEGDIHGYISVADVKFGLDGAANAGAATTNVGDITAKIVAGDLYVKLNENTDPGFGYAFDADSSDHGNIADDTYYTLTGKKYGAKDVEWNFANISNTVTTATASSGIEIGYTIPSVAAITAAVGSDQDWTGVYQSDYEGSVELSLLAVEKLTLKAKYFGYGLNSAVKSNAGATVAFDAGVVVPFADVNFNVDNSKYAADFGAKLPLVDGLKVLALATYDSDSYINALGVVEIASGKVAGPLSANIGVKALDLTKKVASAASFELFAKVGLKATDTLSLSTTVDAVNDNSLFAKVSCEYTGISLTTLGVYWDSSDLGAAKTTGTSQLGKVVLTAKVAY